MQSKRCEICDGFRQFSDSGICTGCGTEPKPKEKSIQTGLYRQEIRASESPYRPAAKVYPDGLWRVIHWVGAVRRTAFVRLSGGFVVDAPDSCPEWIGMSGARLRRSLDRATFELAKF